MSVADRLDEKYDLGKTTRLVQAKCATTSPFTVTLAGGSDPVPAQYLAGQSWSEGEIGYALRVDGLPPICFKTS